MQIDKYYMPRYLDEPYKVAFFTIDEVVILLATFISALMMFNAPLYGLIVGSLSVALLKKIKGQEGYYLIYHLAYWYLPPLVKFRSTPPSHLREILG